MAEERKDSFAETVDTAASAAHTVKGAIKAGKAISGAAKGAAAGGPYGAVAGAVWAGRKHIGKIIAVIARGDEQVRRSADFVIEVPVIAECLMPIVVSVPLQLLAYYIAVYKGRDVDQPRNLAKSVTVE